MKSTFKRLFDLEQNANLSLHLSNNGKQAPEPSTTFGPHFLFVRAFPSALTTLDRLMAAYVTNEGTETTEKRNRYPEVQKVESTSV